jgi:hypothetical protein
MPARKAACSQVDKLTGRQEIWVPKCWLGRAPVARRQHFPPRVHEIVSESSQQKYYTHAPLHDEAIATLSRSLYDAEMKMLFFHFSFSSLAVDGERGGRKEAISAACWILL